MRAASVFALLAIAALVGCGSSGPPRGSRAAYDQGLQTAAKNVEDAVAGAGLFGTTADYQAAAQAFRDAANQLGRLQPPANVAADHGRLEAGLRFMAGRERAIVAAAGRHDQGALESLLRGLSQRPEIRQALAAIDDLRRKGYRGVDGLFTFGSG
jgi:predicted small lipoprotein YifL